MSNTILLDKFELSDYLGCHPWHIWRLVREGRLSEGRRYYGLVGVNNRRKYWTKADADKFIRTGT